MIKRIIVEENILPTINYEDCDTTKIIIAITQNHYYLLKEILEKEWIWVDIKRSSKENIDEPLIKYPSANFAIIEMLGRSDIVHVLQLDNRSELNKI